MLLTTWLLACKSATPTPEPTDTDTDVPTPEACTDDLDEPNDTSDDAVAIEGNHLAVLASGNEDWWSITVPAGQRADVTLIAPASGANLELELTFPTGSVLASSTNQAGEDEQVATYNIAPFDQTFLLRAFRADGLPDTCEDYALQVDLACEEADVDAPDARTDALEVGVGETIAGQAAGDDWDWYAIDIGPGEHDTLTVHFANTVDTLDYEVWIEDSPDQELDDGTLADDAPLVLNNADSVTLTFYVGLRSTHGVCNLYDVVITD